MLTSEEQKHGYWGARHIAGDLPSRHISYPEELTSADSLSLACTQRRGLTATEQRKLVNDWCELLPTLHLKTLILSSKANQKLFEAAVRITGLESLSIKWSSIKSIASVENCKTLKEIEIGSSPSLTGLRHLENLPRLRSLVLENVREAEDLSFASNLTSIEEFGVSGSIWNTQRIESLLPLKYLQQLQYLWITNAKILKDGLRPLHDLPRLTTLQCTFNFTASEFLALRSSVPSLKYGSPFEYSSIEQLCKG